MAGVLRNLNERYETENRFFDCPVVQLSQLENRMFYILDFADGARTKFGEGRYIVKVSGRPDDDPKNIRKFVTNAGRLKYTLDALRESGQLPCRVMLKKQNRQYSFEDPPES